MITLDSAFPLVSIPNYQFHLLQSTTKGTESVRMLMDFLFEEEAFAEKNCTYIRTKFEDKYNVILRYASRKHSMKATEVNKCITNKCTQTKLKKAFN